MTGTVRNRHIRGAGGGLGGLLGTNPTTAKDTLSSNSWGRSLEVVSEGPIVGLVNGTQSIFLDQVAITNSDLSINHKGVTWGFRAGNPTQDWVQGFADVESESGVQLQVIKSQGPVVRTTGNPDIDSIRVTVSVPSLQSTDSNGNVAGASIGYSLEYRNNADVAWTSFTGSPFTLSGKSSSTYQEQKHQLLRPAGSVQTGPWFIRMTRLSADHPASTTVSDDLYWFSFTEIIEQKLIYPDTAYFALQLPAKSFGGRIPQRSFLVDGRIVRVPFNYTPRAYKTDGTILSQAVYTGIWDGTFKLAWTDNPCWCLLDMATHTRYGLGQADSRVDTAALYTISQYCDALVSDGQAGTQPRYTLNVVIRDQDDAYALINKICSNFSAMAYYTSGGITFTQDSPRTPDMLVTEANVEGGMFDYPGGSYRDTANQIMVQWNNPLMHDAGESEVVEDDSDISQRGLVSQSYDAFGVRDQTRAHRMGRWAMYSGFFNNDIVHFKGGLDFCDCVPGWILSVRDRLIDSSIHLGGRCLPAGAGSTVNFDRTVVLNVGDTYTLRVLHPDKSLHDYPVTTPAGSVSSVDITGSVPANMEGCIWQLYTTVNIPQLFRVVSKTPVDAVSFQIVAIRHRPDKYALIESNLTIDPNRYTNPNTAPVGPPLSVAIKEFITLLPSGAVAPAILIGWNASIDARVLRYTIQVRQADDEWQDVGVTSELTFELDNTPPGRYAVRVRGETNIAKSSVWMEVDINLVGLGAIPPDITNFAITVIGNRATLTWDPSPALNTQFYEIRYSSLTGGASWISTPALVENIIGTSVDVPALAGTYLIKALTYGGTYSATAATIINTLAGQDTPNIIQTFAEEPSWSGTKVNVVVNTGSHTILLASTNFISSWTTLSSVSVMSPGPGGFLSSGSYHGNSFPYDLGAVYTARVTPSLVAVGSNSLNTLAGWITLAAQLSLAATIEGEWTAEMQFRFTQTDPAASPTWTDWRSAVVGDYTFRGIDMQILLSNSGNNYTTPVVSAADISIVMPDRIISNLSTSVPIGGLTVTFSPAYRSLKGIGVALKGIPQGGYYTISAESVSGFTIQCFNASNVAIAGCTVHYVSTGFGKVGG